MKTEKLILQLQQKSLLTKEFFSLIPNSIQALMSLLIRARIFSSYLISLENTTIPLEPEVIHSSNQSQPADEPP
jgi:hypothetical protein